MLNTCQNNGEVKSLLNDPGKHSTTGSLPGLVQERMLSNHVIAFTHSKKYKRNIVQLLSISYMLKKYKKGKNK